MRSDATQGATIVLGTTSQGIEDVARDEGTTLLERAGVEVLDSHVKGFDRPGIVTWEVGPIDAPAAAGAANPDANGSALCGSDANRRLRERVWDALRPARSLYHVAVHLAEPHGVRDPARMVGGRPHHGAQCTLIDRPFQCHQVPPPEEDIRLESVTFSSYLKPPGPPELPIAQ